jgi:hypothetical protein
LQNFCSRSQQTTANDHITNEQRIPWQTPKHYLCWCTPPESQMVNLLQQQKQMNRNRPESSQTLQGCSQDEA